MTETIFRLKTMISSATDIRWRPPGGFRARAGGGLQPRLWMDRKTGLTLAAQDRLTTGSSVRFEPELLGRQPKNYSSSPPAGVAVVKHLEPDFKAMGELRPPPTSIPRPGGCLWVMCLRASMCCRATTPRLFTPLL